MTQNETSNKENNRDIIEQQSHSTWFFSYKSFISSYVNMRDIIIYIIFLKSKNKQSIL